MKKTFYIDEKVNNALLELSRITGLKQYQIVNRILSNYLFKSECLEDGFSRQGRSDNFNDKNKFE